MRRQALAQIERDGEGPRVGAVVAGRLVEAGKVALVRGPWVSAFLDEVAMFDGSGATHDDQVDAVSGALPLLARGRSSAASNSRARKLSQRRRVFITAE